MRNLFVKVVKKYQTASNLTSLFTFFLLIFSIAFILFHLFLLAFSLLPLSSQLLFFISIGLKIVLLAIAIYLFWGMSAQWLNRWQAANELDKSNQDKADSYQNALELYEKEDINPAILQKIIASAEQKAENQIISLDKNRIKNAFTVFLIIMTVNVVLLLFATPFYRSGWNYFSSFQMPEIEHKTYVELEPGDLSIQRNSGLMIQVIEPEKDVEHRFYYRRDDLWREEPLVGYQRRFDNLDFSFDYFVRTPYAVSDTFRIQVFELPAIRDLTLFYRFPEYTKLGTETEHNSNGFIRAVQGTEVTLDLEANNPLDECRMIFSDETFIEGERQGRNSFRFRFSLVKSMNYHFQMIDFLGNRSEKIEKSIIVFEDQKPEIRITRPGRDTLLTKNMILPITIFASDDYGLQNLNLHHFVNEHPEQKRLIRRNFQSTSVEEEHLFDLSDTFLLPGDRITYWVSIQDNAPSPQTSFSQRYVARFPSIEEIYQEVEREDQQRKETLQTAFERSKQMQDEFEKKRREMLRKDEFDWQDKQEIEAFLNEQENLNADIEQVVQEYQKMIETLEMNQAFSQEMLEKMEKIKELMEEITSDQLQEAMKNLQEKMEQMSPEDIRRAMEEMKFSLEDFSQRIEQTLALLEEIQKEQALQKALEISKEMEAMQSELMDRLSEEAAEQLAEEQKQIEDKLAALEEQLLKADSLLDEEKDADLKQKMQELLEQLAEDGLQQDLEKSSEALQMQDMDMAMEMQQQASSKMKQMSAKMEEMMEMMASGSMSDIGDIIDKTILRLLLISELQKNSKQRYTNDPFLIFYEQIANFEGIKIALNELYATPMVFLILGPKFIHDSSFTISAYQEMFAEISDAKNRKVPGFLEDIQKGINLMIFDLMQAKDDMQSGGGGGGSGMESLMQSLQQMGEQQMMMNMLTQELFQQMGEEGRMSQEMRNQARKLAEQQERMAENLQRILQTDREAQRQTAALSQLIEELEGISRNLRQNRIDQSLLDRQARIMSRMLDLQRSIHKREFTEKRKGETGEQTDWQLPEEIKLQFDKIRRDAILRQNLDSYPKAFQDLIKEYFKKVNEKAGEN